MLFVDDTDASFVGAAGDGFDVFCRLALFCEVGVDLFGGFDGGLGVELGWVEKPLVFMGVEGKEKTHLGMRL